MRASTRSKRSLEATVRRALRLVRAAAYQRRYYQAHKAERAAYQRRWYKAHQAERVAYQRRYRQAHKAELLWQHKQRDAGVPRESRTKF